MHKVWAKVFDTHMGQCLVQQDRNEEGVWGIRVSFLTETQQGTGRFDQFYEPKDGVDVQAMFDTIEQEDADEGARVFEEVLIVDGVKYGEELLKEGHNAVD